MSIQMLNLEQPKLTADFESNVPTGVSLDDLQGMEQFLIGLGTKTGQVVTPAKAQRCSAVLACMRIISEDLSALRLVLYKKTKNGVEEADDHPLFRLLDVAPNAIQTPMELREHIIFDMMLYGQFFVLKNGDTELESLWPLQAGYVTRRWQELVWTFSDPLTGISGQFGVDDAWRGTIMSSNGVDGQALTLLAREAIGLLLAAEEQGARLFKHGVQTDLALQTDDTIDAEGKAQLREAFQLRHGGSLNAWMPLILEGGLKASRIGLTAQESQYIETRKFQIEDIARVFRVPEVLLGNSTSGKASTYASAEQFFQSYVKHTLTPWAVRIEQTINRDLLSPKEAQKFFARHDFSSLLRGDTAARYASYATGIDKGFLSPAYARFAENLPFVAGLDYYNKPAPPPPSDAPAPGEGVEAPTDENAKTDKLRQRVAEHILRKEHKALAGGQEPSYFYAQISGFIEDLTGGNIQAVLSYCEMRRKTDDRFSTEAWDAAVSSLSQLCKKDA